MGRARMTEVRRLLAASALFAQAVLALAGLTGCASPSPSSHAAATAAGTGGNAMPPPVRAYRGELDLWLVPYDESGACSVTVGLSNLSGVRQGEAWLALAWRGGDGAELVAPARIRMDPLLPGRYNAKNETLPLRCREIVEVWLSSAEWKLFAGGDAPAQPMVPILGINGTRWRLVWSDDKQAWRGERQIP